MHACHNTLCVNPRHLELGTNDDNQLAKAKDGQCWNAKITPDDVRAIRRCFAAGERQRVIAKDYGLSQCSVSDIICGRSWGHVK